MKKLLKVKTKDKTEYRNSDGNLHRDNDPTIVLSNGYKAWYQNNKRHRDNGPAIIGSDGTQWWYRDGKLHRDNDLPAYIHSNGHKAWWVNGKCIKREKAT